tara:strand:+ start:2491 stop:3246 length:756 start_codon:yes stop_codon:yes gene_type:complete
MKKVLITSIGRTGTVSLTNFLNTIDGVCCFHEKNRQDVPFLFLSQLDQFSNIKENYLKQRDIQASKVECKFYIEVNPYFRFVEKKTLDSLGWRKIFIVRNPKSYIESVYTRNLFTEKDIICGQFPDNNDSVSKLWGDLTRFQKICWYYGKVHKHILDSNYPYYRFEDLVNSPSSLKDLLVSLGVSDFNINGAKLPKHREFWKTKLKKKLMALTKSEINYSSKLNWNSLAEAELEFYNIHCVIPAKKLGYVL